MIRRGCLALLCLLAAPAAATAQSLEDYDYEYLTFRGAGLEYGWIWPTKVEPTAAYSLKVDLGFLGPNVRVAPSLSFWSSRVDAEELRRLADQLSDLGVSITPAELGRIEWRDFSLSVDGQYVFEVEPRVMPYVGAGVGVHIFDGSGPAVDGTFLEDLLDSITAGLNAVAGIEVSPVRRFRIGVEARYTLVEDVRYPEVRIGASYTLPTNGGGV